MADQNSDLPRRRNCATMEVHAALAATDEQYRTNRRQLEAITLDRTHARLAPRTRVVTIPVVVHVVAATDAEDISDRQVRSQIEILTRDYRKQNADAANVPGPFQQVAVDTRIEFALAVRDPAGKRTRGITRTRTTTAAFTQDDAVKFAARGGHDAWPRDRYLNIWVCTLANQLLGYAQFPGGNADTDGVVILNTAFGDTGSAAPPFDRGRTTVHEVGHWLNLLHIWGDDARRCTGSDNVTDTPNCAGENFGTPAFPHVTCKNGPNGDMFMNYMDYVDDAAMFMFTAGQLARMDTTLAGPRASLLLSDALTPAHVTPPMALPPIAAHAPRNPLAAPMLGARGVELDAITAGLTAAPLIPPIEVGTAVTHVFDGVGWVPVGAALPSAPRTAPMSVRPDGGGDD